MQEPEPQPGRPDADPPVERLRAGSTRGAWLPLILVLAGVAIGVVRPWAVITDAPSIDAPSAGAADGTATPSPTQTPEPTDPYAELVVTCGYPSGWRAATLQHWIGREAPIRTWTAVDPVPAGGAADPRIPYAPIATDLVLAIGFCSPVGSDQPPQGIAVEIWSVPDDAAPIRIDGRRLEPVHENALGGLWLPGAGQSVTVDGATGWTSGRYAIRLGARSFDRWLGLAIEDISGLRRDAPSPGASP